ncbi:MAG: excinuclease ABC subunit UvrC [Candidatus Hodarchaeota archaeon]
MVPKAPIFDSILKILPEQPGCYLMLNGTGKIIYIGAASNLKKRVTSYFQKDIIDKKTKQLVSNIKSIDYEIHDSEEAAFLRERELIRIHSPRFNLDWRDDKEYPMIKITVPSEKEIFSRIFIVRSIEDSDNWYFGRKTDVKALRQSLRFLRKIFPVANKTYCFRTKKPCLDYSISRCSAPCVDKISLKEYQQIVDQFVLFLQGKRKDLLDKLYEEMNQYSDELDFEKAAIVRDRMTQIESAIESQKGFPQPREKDVIILIEESDHYMLLIFWYKDNNIINTEIKNLGNLETLPESEIIKTFILNYYLKGDFIPSKITTNSELSEENEILEIWLSKRKGSSVQIISDKAFLLDSNIKLKIHQFQLELGEHIRSKKKQIQLKVQALDEIKEYLELKKIPSRIEAFDISNIQGTNAVGSMVVFQNGVPDKSQYRRFRIKTLTPEPNDVAMMREVLSRRLTHDDLQFSTSLPDLLVVDGGTPQVNVIARELKLLEYNIPVIGLAKKEERIFLPYRRKPLNIPQNSLALQLLKQTRDEAHRFAISYHKKRRLLQPKTQLEEIPGIGIKRRNALLQYFGSINEIKKATVEELAQVEGISREIAERVFLFFASNPEI